METVLWVIGGIIILGSIALLITLGIVARKSYKAVKKVHTVVKREFDDVWKSSSETTRTYSPPARPVARSLSSPAPRKSSSSTRSKSNDSGLNRSDDGFLLYGASAASFSSYGSSDSGSSYSSSSSSDSGSSSSDGGSCGGGGE